MTGYVATRWYRAPEIMLNWMHYNQTGDVSSHGAACGSGPGWAGPAPARARGWGWRADSQGYGMFRPWGLGHRPGISIQKQAFRGAEYGGSCPGLRLEEEGTWV